MIRVYKNRIIKDWVIFSYDLLGWKAWFWFYLVRQFLDAVRLKTFFEMCVEIDYEVLICT